MRDVATLFREYARLDLRRLDQGLSVTEHERWSALKAVLDQRFGRTASPSSATTRRSAKRVATQINCSYAAGDEHREAVIANLSTGGVFIRTTCPLPVDTALRLNIRLEDTGASIVVQGVVVSNNVSPGRDPGVRGMGVRFVRVDADLIEQISSLYSNELTRDVKQLAPVD